MEQHSANTLDIDIIHNHFEEIELVVKFDTLHSSDEDFETLHERFDRMFIETRIVHILTNGMYLIAEEPIY